MNKSLDGIPTAVQMFKWIEPQSLKTAFIRYDSAHRINRCPFQIIINYNIEFGFEMICYRSSSTKSIKKTSPVCLDSDFIIKASISPIKDVLLPKNLMSIPFTHPAKFQDIPQNRFIHVNPSSLPRDVIIAPSSIPC